MNTHNIAIIVLAAGGSSRLGRPKQLLEIEGESMLRRSVKVAVESLASKVYTVLGYNHTEHIDVLNDIDTEIVLNSDWEKGMGSSLKCGLKKALAKDGPDAIIVMVCDQPEIMPQVINDLISKYDRGNKIVASEYDQILGVPALFGREYFEQLLSLPDNKGAQKVIDQNQVSTVLFPGGILDIDTEKDWWEFNH